MNRLELVAAGHLLQTWVRRDFRVRYSQTVLGGVWAIAQPAGVTLALVFLVKRLGGADTSGVPYASFVFTGMLIWSLFSAGCVGGVYSIANSMPIVAKVRFPRLVAPISGALLPTVDFALACLFLPPVLLIQGSGHVPDALPLILAVIGTVTLSAGIGIAVGALAVFVRDLRNALPFVLQLLLLASPVAYETSKLPAVLQWNPMATFISGFRAALIHSPAPDFSDWLRALLVSVCVFALGAWYFSRVEDRFADVA